MRRQRHPLAAISAALLLIGFLALTPSALGEVYFGHAPGTTGVPPAPPNAVFAAPDVADIFFTNVVVNSTPGPNLGNSLAGNNPAVLGLLPGDDLDAVHLELRPLGDPSTGNIAFSPAFTFSPDQGSLGQPGTPVNFQAPINSGDFYQWTYFGQHVLSLDENQIGLAPAVTENVDSFFLTPLLSGTPPNSNRVFFSLAPGSPTLAALGASAADILSAPVGGPAMVSITANQLGLDFGDDVDGLVMLHGIDANADGDFDDAGDTFPWVNFSVSPSSQGLLGTAVANQVATDPPVGGDVYFSLGGGVNALFFDEGAFGLGLNDADNVNGLDLPELAIFPGLPGSTPFTAGPWGSGGGPPINPPPPPPPPPGGGGGGCVNAVRFSVCAGGEGRTKITLDAKISCNGGAVMSANNSPQCIVVDCDDANAIVQAMMAALGNITGPGGVPVFGGSVVAGNSGMASGTINVNPNFTPMTGCKLVTISLRWGPPCITINMALLSMAVSIPVDNFTVIEGDATSGGEYMLQLSEDDVKITIPFTPGVTAEGAVQEIVKGLTDQGFVVESEGNQFSIVKRPDGQPLTDFFATGILDTDFTGAEFRYEWPYVPPCKSDINGDRVVDDADLELLESRLGSLEEGVGEGSADLNRDGVVDRLDAEILIDSYGACPVPIDVHSEPVGIAPKPLMAK